MDRESYSRAREWLPDLPFAVYRALLDFDSGPLSTFDSRNTSCF